MHRGVGLDFGTTNSAVAWVGPDGEGHLATFPTADGATSTFRSALHFPSVEKRPLKRPAPSCGPAAIETYLDEGGGGRFLQSIKSSQEPSHSE